MLEQVGHYKVLDRIGAGGIGEAYRARDTRAGRTVVVKHVSQEIAGNQATLQRFLTDARASAALSHPGIASIHEVISDESDAYLVSDFIAGQTLTALSGGRPLNARHALDAAIQIADALADVHAAGIVYGDLKPENVIVTPKGTVKLLDVGLTSWTSGSAQRATASKSPAALGAASIGTISYMSPEQVIGDAVDHRTDVFSLGVVLFELLTGTLPFQGTSPAEVTLQIVQATAPAPKAVNRTVPRMLDRIVGKVLAKSVDARFESMAALAAELRTVRNQLDVTEREPVPLTNQPKRPFLAWTLAGIVLMAMAWLVWMATRVQ
jgi:serine/threonine protein kinase